MRYQDRYNSQLTSFEVEKQEQSFLKADNEMKKHKHIEELEKAVRDAEKLLEVVEAELEAALDPLSNGWYLITAETPVDQWLLVSSGEPVNDTGLSIIIAKQTRVHYQNRYFWCPQFGGGEYMGAKYWQYLPELPCED